MIESLYATPIYYSIVKNKEEIQSSISNCIDNINFSMKEEWGSTLYLSNTTFNDNIIEILGLNLLSEEIDRHLSAYCSELEFNMPEYTMTSWFTLSKKGNYSHIHHHAPADISGVYYYKTTEKDGSLFFESPNPHLDATRCYGKKYGESWRHPPIEGKILLFPGWLKHGVETNETDSERISLSFNVKYK
tara:strand:- start:149 stop:715 length:567 start_codon:yes stop_codon:yes gene_type:complete